MFSQFSDEITLEVVNKLPVQDLVSLEMVDDNFYRLTNDQSTGFSKEKNKRNKIRANEKRIDEINRMVEGSVADGHINTWGMGSLAAFGGTVTACNYYGGMLVAALGTGLTLFCCKKSQDSYGKDMEEMRELEAEIKFLKKTV